VSEVKPHIYDLDYGRIDDRRHKAYAATLRRSIMIHMDSTEHAQNLPGSIQCKLRTLDQATAIGMDKHVAARYPDGKLPAGITFTGSASRYSRDSGVVMCISVRKDVAKPSLIPSKKVMQDLLPWSDEQLISIFEDIIRSNNAERQEALDLQDDMATTVMLAKHIAGYIEKKARRAARIDQRLAALHAEIAAEYALQCGDLLDDAIKGAFKEWKNGDGCYLAMEEDVAGLMAAATRLIESFCTSREVRAYDLFPRGGNSSGLAPEEYNRWVEVLRAALHATVPAPYKKEE
jgi:hypothetical protein